MHQNFFSFTKVVVMLIAAVLCIVSGAVVNCSAQTSTTTSSATSTTSSVPMSDILNVISIKPDHVHRVASGAQTTFVLSVYNAGADATATVERVSVTPGWEAVLSDADPRFQPTGSGSTELVFDIGAGTSHFVVVTVTQTIPPADGQICSIEVNAALSTGASRSKTLQAVVSSQPKVYFILIDACSPYYLRLGRRGNLNPVSDLLMPNVSNFVQEAARFSNPSDSAPTRDSLPSGTDPNIFGILSGSWPGTSGLCYVTFYFYGWDASGNPVTDYISADKLRYGPPGPDGKGQPVLSIFDVAKDPTYGGDPDNFTAYITGKYFMTHPFRTDTNTTLDILANGNVYPGYLVPPPSYVMGDPITDDDAGAPSDRNGTNITPRNQYHMIVEGMGATGDDPSNPSDRWIAESAMRIIAAEDPDIFAIHLANTDKVQHSAGAADTPAEWIDPGTPGILWDDINIYNRNANQDPVLDVFHEADFCTGLILNTLESRAINDKSIIVVASDHRQHTYMNDQLDIQGVLDAAGLGNEARKVTSWMEVGTVILYDEYKSDASAVAKALEDYTIFHPFLQQTVHPFVAITQDEMLSSVDSVIGQFGRTGVGKRSEMYSEWNIDYPVSDNSKVVWPDIFVFSQYRYQCLKTQDQLDNVIGGHAGNQTMDCVLAIKGPGFKQGMLEVEDTSQVDIVPTIYKALGWTAPGNVDGRSLNAIFQ